MVVSISSYVTCDWPWSVTTARAQCPLSNHLQCAVVK